MRAIILISLITIIAAGCGNSYSPCDSDAIRYGMSMDEVREISGYPDRVFTWFDATYFIYVCGQEELWVGFESGIVASVEFEKRYF